jgi:glyoxylase-like metal-dependent hydrolase (beta-lactamase superfamily II)
MELERITLGNVEVFKVVELQGRFGAPGTMVPDCDPEVWRENREWLVPDFWDPDSDSVVAAVQTWVLRSEGRTVLVDTGVGNGRERPGAPHFAGWDTDFLDRLARAGVRPEDVDVVVNTHLHGDHVGWNTVEHDGAWVPTFPNATYLIPAADHAFYGPDGAARTAGDNHRFVFADSVEPVLRSGRAVLWDGTHRIDGNLVLESAPGHTPGSSVLRLASGGDRAVFVGDLVHSPVQLLEPSCSSGLCQDPRRSAASRRRVLERAADERELVIPAHFAGSGVAEVHREGDRFGLGLWAARDTSPRPPVTPAGS